MMLQECLYMLFGEVGGAALTVVYNTFKIVPSSHPS